MDFKIIFFNNKPYHWFEEFGDMDTAILCAKEIKNEHKGVQFKIVITGDTDLLSKMFPSKTFHLYFDKKLRLI